MCAFTGTLNVAFFGKLKAGNKCSLDLSTQIFVHACTCNKGVYIYTYIHTYYVHSYILVDVKVYGFAYVDNKFCFLSCRIRNRTTGEE